MFTNILVVTWHLGPLSSDKLAKSVPRMELREAGMDETGKEAIGEKEN